LINNGGLVNLIRRITRPTYTSIHISCNFTYLVHFSVKFKISQYVTFG
jgi:hypothetical protein